MATPIEEYVIFNDAHWPYESSLYDTALDFLETRPLLKSIYLNGDLLEVESLTSHPRHPLGIKFFKDEIDYGNARFDELEVRFQGVPVHLNEGNHCYRFFRYLRDKAPELFGLKGMSIPEQFEFKKRKDYSFLEYSPTQLKRCGKSNLYLRHEPIGSGSGHAKTTAERSIIDIAYGHTHVYQEYTDKKFGPIPLINTATSLGWIGDSREEIFGYRPAKEHWCELFTLVQCEVKTGAYTKHILKAENEDGGFLWEGQLWPRKRKK